MGQQWYRNILLDTTGCWEWTGHVNQAGYGIVSTSSGGEWRHTRAHRFVYNRLVGDIPAGMVLHHTCENKKCVRPSHTQVMSRKDHLALHGSGPSKWTHCTKGHELTPENRGKRGRCKICARDWMRQKRLDTR